MTRSIPATLVGHLAVALARAVTGVRADWSGCTPSPAPRVYFANHSSHGDFVLIWAVLPGAVRRLTRPVAGADYWNRSAARRFLGREVFDAVLIDRGKVSRDDDPVGRMTEALDAGTSLILFPEGTRNMGTGRLQPLKSGLYHLARSRPEVDLVPVWIENLNRVMPKGSLLPVPLLCTVTFGAPIRLGPEEPRAAFLERAGAALLALGDREGRR